MYQININDITIGDDDEVTYNMYFTAGDILNEILLIVIIILMRICRHNPKPTTQQYTNFQMCKHVEKSRLYLRTVVIRSIGTRSI